MALEFSIEITDQDLPFFMDAIKRAEQRAAGKSAQQILDEAAKTFAGSQAQQMPTTDTSVTRRTTVSRGRTRVGRIQDTPRHRR